MAGQYGNARSTMRNLKLVRIDAENNLLLVRGAVPGPNGGYVIIQANEQTVTAVRDAAAGSTPIQLANARIMAKLDRLRSHGQEGRHVRHRADRSCAAHQQAIAARRGGDVPVEPAAGYAQDQEPRTKWPARPRRCIARRARATPVPARVAAASVVAAVTSSPSGPAIGRTACRARPCSWPRGWRWPRRCATTQIVLIDELEFDAPKTKDMAAHPQGAGAATARACWWPRPSYDVNVYKSARNIDRVDGLAGGGPERLDRAVSRSGC